MHLNGLVQNPLHRQRRGDLDGLNLGVRTAISHGVHQPGGLEHQQSQLLDPHAGFGDPVADHALLGQRLAERDATGGPPAHHFDGTLRNTDGPHAVVDAARPEASLGDGESAALFTDQVRHRHPDIGEPQLGMAAMVVVVVAEHLHATQHLEPRGVPGNEDLRLLAMALRTGVRLAHDDEDGTVGIHCSGDPPLASVDHVVVAVTHDGQLDIGGIGAGHVWLGHREGGPNLSGQQWLQPLALLRFGAEFIEHLHVSGVRCGTVEDGGRQLDTPAGDFGERRVLQVGQTGALGAGQEQIPQTATTGLGTQLGEHRDAVPGPPVVQSRQLLMERLLGGIDVAVHERRQFGDHFVGLGVVREFHVSSPSMRSVLRPAGSAPRPRRTRTRRPRSAR